MIQNYLCIFCVSFMKHKQTGTSRIWREVSRAPNKSNLVVPVRNCSVFHGLKQHLTIRRKWNLFHPRCVKNCPASRCKNESNARVADVMRKVEMQKKKGGIK